MKEFFVEYFNQGSSVKRRERVSARSAAEAITLLKEDKGSDIIIHSTKQT